MNATKFSDAQKAFILKQGDERNGRIRRALLPPLSKSQSCACYPWAVHTGQHPADARRINKRSRAPNLVSDLG